MSDFVEQCRLEWRRLGVPDPLADEMAADLASDLREAEAEGLSVEEVLGSSASDPRSFAASWAAERGIIPAPPSRRNARRRPLILLAFTALAAIVLIVAALLLLTGQPKATLATSGPQPHLQSQGAAPFVPFGPGRQLLLGNLSAPVEWILLFFAIVALGFAAWLWSSWARSRPPGCAGLATFRRPLDAVRLVIPRSETGEDHELASLGSSLSFPTLVFALDHKERAPNCSGQFGLLPGKLEFPFELLGHIHPL